MVGNAVGHDQRSLYFFFRFSIVRLKRNDSVPVSMMLARSVTRPSNALHNRGFGNTVVHSENGERYAVPNRSQNRSQG
jgi:hypothetical protein